jgi:hypothetical protein
VRPGARAVSAHAAVALPVFDAAVEVRGVVGIAYAQEGEIPPAQTHQLAAAAAAAPVVMPA